MTASMPNAGRGPSPRRRRRASSSKSPARRAPAWATAPAIWNTVLRLMVAVVPRAWWSSKRFSEGLARFSEPLVRVTDAFVGESHAMRVDVSSATSAATVAAVRPPRALPAVRGPELRRVRPGRARSSDAGRRAARGAVCRRARRAARIRRRGLAAGHDGAPRGNVGDRFFQTYGPHYRQERGNDHAAPPPEAVDSVDREIEPPLLPSDDGRTRTTAPTFGANWLGRPRPKSSSTTTPVLIC